MIDEDAVRVGVLAGDPLRALGLEVILGEVPEVQSVLLTMETLAGAEELGALILDSRLLTEPLAEVLARLRRERPSTRVILIAESMEPKEIQDVIGAGAKGYLAETASESEIRMAVEVVLDDSVWAPRKVLAKLLEAGLAPEQAAPGPGEAVAQMMTPREREVLHLLMDGRSNRSIAEVLGIDEATVKAHLGRMLRKSGCTNRVELTLMAMEQRQGS